MRLRWFITIALVSVSGTLLSDSGPLVLVYTTRNQLAAEPVRLELSRSHRQLMLYRGAEKIRSYSVAVGRPGWETPLGDYKVLDMVRDPEWKHPLTGKVYESGEPGNELGHHWIGFSNNKMGLIGFHGTPHPETVGKAVSHGCVRMLEADIAELYGQVQVGTMVIVRP